MSHFSMSGELPDADPRSFFFSGSGRRKADRGISGNSTRIPGRLDSDEAAGTDFFSHFAWTEIDQKLQLNAA